MAIRNRNNTVKATSNGKQRI